MKQQMIAFVVRHQRAILYLAIAEVVALIALDLVGIVVPGARLVLLTL